MRIPYDRTTLHIFGYLANLGAYFPPQNLELNGMYSFAFWNRQTDVTPSTDSLDTKGKDVIASTRLVISPSLDSDKRELFADIPTGIQEKETTGLTYSRP